MGRPKFKVLDRRDDEPQVHEGPLTLEGLFRRYAGYVAATATKLLGRDEEVDDVVQDVFLAAARGLDRVEDPTAIKAWLATIAVRVSMRRLRWRRFWKQLRVDPGASYDELADTRLSGEERAVVARIYSLLDRIPAAQRVAWTLHHIDGMPAETVARVCECSLATAKRRIFAVSDALKREITGE